jgi:hypothetical protein
MSPQSLSQIKVNPQNQSHDVTWSRNHETFRWNTTITFIDAQMHRLLHSSQFDGVLSSAAPRLPTDPLTGSIFAPSPISIQKL